MKSFWGEARAAAVESWNSLIFVLSSLFCLADAASSLVTSNLIPTRSSPLLLLLCFSFLKRSAFRDFLEILTFVCDVHYSHKYIYIFSSLEPSSAAVGRRTSTKKWAGNEATDERTRLLGVSEREKKHFKKNPLNPQIMNMLASMLGMLYKVHRKKIHESCFSQSSP